jgi:hypothetical protein
MQRHRVYKRLVSNVRMHKDNAQRHIAILSAVASDYRDKLTEGPLFNFGAPGNG